MFVAFADADSPTGCLRRMEYELHLCVKTAERASFVSCAVGRFPENLLWVEQGLCLCASRDVLGLRERIKVRKKTT